MPHSRLAVVLGALLAASVIVAGVYFTRFRAEVAEVPAPAVAPLNDLIARPVALDVSAVPADQCLEDLGRKYGVAVVIENRAGASAFPANPKILITHHVPSIALGDALRTIALEMDPQALLTLQEDGVHIFDRFEDEEQVVTQFFSTGALLSQLGTNDAALARAITKTIAPETWDTEGGKFHMEARAGGLAVANNPEVVAQIEKSLTCLESMCAARETSPQWVEADEAAASEGVHKRMQQTLEALPNFKPEMPFGKVMELYERQIGVPVCIDTEALVGKGCLPSLPIHRVILGVTCAESLGILLNEMELQLTVRHGAIWITSSEVADCELRRRAYFVGDILHAAPEKKVEHVVELVQSTIQPESWDTVGGRGAAAPMGNIVLVSQTAYVHEQVQALLEGLRRVLLHGEKGPVSVDPWLLSTPEEQTILAALERNVSLDFRERPLGEVCEMIGRQAGIRVYVDRKAIEAVGASIDSPISLKRMDWPLRECLRCMLRPLDLTYVVRDSVLYITTPEEAGSKLVTHIFGIGHLVDPHLGVFVPATSTTVTDTLQTIVAPESWDAVGGKGALTTFGEALVISQTAEVLRQVAGLLEGLGRYQKLPPSLAPLDLGARRLFQPPPAHIRAELTKKVNWNFYDVTLAEIDKECRARFGISFDKRFAADVPNTHTTCRLVDVPLGDALRVVLLQQQVRYEIDYDQLIPMDRMPQSMRLYPVGDICCAPLATQLPAAPLRSPGNRFFSGWPPSFAPSSEFLKTIQRVVEPESWDGCGGWGAATQLRGAILVVQSTFEQEELEHFFTRLRAARKTEAEAPFEHSAPEGDVLLARRVTLNIKPASLVDFVWQLGEQLHVSVSTSGSPISAANVSCHVKDMPLADALRGALAGTNVTVAVRRGVLVFEDREGSSWEPRVYNVASLLPSKQGANQESAVSLEAAGEQLIKAVHSVGRATDWEEPNGHAYAAVHENLLFVSHSAIGQYQVRQFLQRLRADSRWCETPEAAPTVTEVLALIDRRQAATDAAERGYLGFKLCTFSKVPAEAAPPVREALAKCAASDGLEWFSTLWTTLEHTGAVTDDDRRRALTLNEQFLSGEYRQQAIALLGRLGPVAIPRLRELLKTYDPADARGLAAACGALGPRGVALLPDVLATMEKASDITVMMQVVNILDPTHKEREMVIQTWELSDEQVFCLRAARLREIFNPTQPGGFF